jgi:hypothetical protein
MDYVRRRLKTARVTGKFWCQCKERHEFWLFLSEDTGVWPSRVNFWSRRSLRRYSMSTGDNFEPLIQLAVKLFHTTVSPIEEYWKLAEFTWLHHHYLRDYNSTREWVAGEEGGSNLLQPNTRIKTGFQMSWRLSRFKIERVKFTILASIVEVQNFDFKLEIQELQVLFYNSPLLSMAAVLVSSRWGTWELCVHYPLILLLA